jgi:hypothetical protein
MAMVCPQCQTAYRQRLQCPQCNVRLLFDGSSPSRGVRKLFASGSWQQTFWGRIFIGLLLSQGLYYGLRQLCVAILLATQVADKATLWTDLPGQLLLQGLQLFSLLIGGLFAGAAQRNGALYGTLLGIWNAIFLVLVQPVFIRVEEAAFLNAVTLYGQPVLQAFLGGLAGWLGSRIWTPATPDGDDSPLRRPRLIPRPRLLLFAGPLAWGRILLGTVTALGGALSAETILRMVVRASDYSLTPGSALQAQLVTWEITALAMFVGGVLAGASTKNGFKQGLAVGIASAVLLCGIRLGGTTVVRFHVLLLSAFVPLILGVAGGAFGGQLLPPLLPRRRKSFESS